MLYFRIVQALAIITEQMVSKDVYKGYEGYSSLLFIIQISPVRNEAVLQDLQALIV